MKFREIKEGDTVTRMLGGVLPMQLKVSKVTDTRIICGAWEFERQQGYEVDEDLGWGIPGTDGQIVSGSFLKLNGGDEE
jgi:hypothetical protein